MKRAVSVSLGSSRRDKRVVVHPHFGRAFIPVAIDRLGLARAVEEELIDELDIRPSVHRLNE